jgi:hypothetical protein
MMALKLEKTAGKQVNVLGTWLHWCQSLVIGEDLVAGDITIWGNPPINPGLPLIITYVMFNMLFYMVLLWKIRSCSNWVKHEELGMRYYENNMKKTIINLQFGWYTTYFS